ncbi:hypothetical protein ACI1US_00288 [Leucobacter sp. BZR 635]
MLLRPSIPTGGRAILPGARKPSVMLLSLSIVPAIAFTIAVVDDRLGFRLFMASLGVMMLVLILALFSRVRGLRPGVIRVAAAGGLRFVPPRAHRAGLVAVPLAMLLPLLSWLMVRMLDLPTQPSSSRLMAALPAVLVAVSLGSLFVVARSMRIPLGLSVGPNGLAGIRGGARVDIAWSDLARAVLVGVSGPRFVLETRAGPAVEVDAHHLGSDPAIVVAVLEFYRLNPARRDELEDGLVAITAVEESSKLSGE